MKNKSQPHDNSAANRRNFFRINHDVVFDCVPVDAYTANNRGPDSTFGDSSALTLAAQLRHIDAEANKKLNLLAERDPILGEYLQLLTRKVDLLARRTIMADEAKQPHVSKRINLSEAGVAFESDRAYYKGNYLAIRLVFLPNYVSVTAFAEVIRCRSTEEDSTTGGERFQVAAHFYRLGEQDRQQLARQILRAQAAHRQKTGSPSTSGDKSAVDGPRSKQ
jgi:hypothetical protein